MGGSGRQRQANKETKENIDTVRGQLGLYSSRAPRDTHKETLPQTKKKKEKEIPQMDKLPPQVTWTATMDLSQTLLSASLSYEYQNELGRKSSIVLRITDKGLNENGRTSILNVPRLFIYFT